MRKTVFNIWYPCIVNEERSQNDEPLDLWQYEKQFHNLNCNKLFCI